MARVDPSAVYIWAGRLLPIILVGIVGYATYVAVVCLCVNYLLHGAEPRAGEAIAILTVYSILLLLMAATYFRLVYIVNFDPGFVPLGPAAEGRRAQQRQERSTKSAVEPLSGRFDTMPSRDMSPDSPGLEEFYTKDIFVSEADGRPKYCSECATWKPDRSHHCSDVGRCVRKMDHFCPWVGGVVGENSFKFFVQFNFYALVYCICLIVAMVYYTVEQIRRPDGSWDRNLAALIGISAFFGLFTCGTSASSIYFAMANLTTIENLSKKNKAWQLAVFLPNNNSQSGITGTSGVVSGVDYPTITYPLPRATEKSALNSAQSTETDANSTDNLHHARDSKATRTFALLRMEPGQNPWDLGALGNWKSVMGNNICDWLLPISRSPCCKHESTESQFPVGRWVEQLKASHGLTSEGGDRNPPAIPGRTSGRGKRDDTEAKSTSNETG